MGADMKRDLLEILNIIFLTAVAIAFIAVSANGQTPDDVLAAQAKADAYMQTLLAEAAQPGPPSRGTLTAAAPASGDYYERLTERVQALEAKVTMLAARLPAQKTTETLTPAQEKRLDAVAAQVAEMKKTLADSADPCRHASQGPRMRLRPELPLRRSMQLPLGRGMSWRAR
jgi:hypothetical protein